MRFVILGGGPAGYAAAGTAAQLGAEVTLVEQTGLGGNCTLTEPGSIVGRAGVTVVGLTDLPSTMPYHASTLFSRNVQALLLHLAPEGELALDWSDEITAGACVAGKQEAPA